MALDRRRSDRGLIQHADMAVSARRCCSQRCAKAGIAVSVGSVGDCVDNALCETFHAS
jgi:putative transposase